MRRRRPASKPDARGRTAWLAVPGPAAGGSTGDRRGSPRRSTGRSPDRHRRSRRRGTGRVAGAVLPGFPGCRRRERSGRRTPPASPGSGSGDQRRPGRLPGAQLSHPQACGAGDADRGSGFCFTGFSFLAAAHLRWGGARKCAATIGPGTWRAGFTVVPGLGGWLQVRQSSAWSALSLARRSMARTARAAPGVSCGSAGLKVTSISSPSPVSAAHASRGPWAAGMSPVMPAAWQATRLDSSGALPADVGPASPHLTCRTEGSVDRRRCTTGHNGPASAASIRGVQGHRVSDLGGE